MMNKMENCHSKIRVYTNGIVDDGLGAYAYIVLENKGGEIVRIGDGGGRLFASTLLRAKFAQAGKCDDSTRMKMRAVYEGVRHCPDGSEVEVFTDNFLMKDILETTSANESDGDIAERYRKYISEHGITPVFSVTKVYNGKDFPNNDHDEWTWWAHDLCADAIKKYKKEKKC